MNRNLLNNTSAQDLDSTLRCAVSNGRPFEIERLQASLDDERKSTGARKTVIRLLAREIARQQRQAGTP